MADKLAKKPTMSKEQIVAKLASFGVKPPASTSKSELTKMLNEARSNGSNPGHSLSSGPQPGDHV